jgi:hypothetical protein
VPLTPDRHPGPLEENEEIRFVTDAGAVPSQDGAVTYDPALAAFRMRDGLGTFDPRNAGTGITEAQHAALDTFLHALDETHEGIPVFDADGIITSITAQAVGGTPLIRNIDSLTVDGDGLVSGFRLQQRDAAGAVVETLTGVVTISGSIPQKSTVTKT